MSITIAIFVTAAVAFPAGYWVNVWWPRKLGTHSTKDRSYSIDVLIAATKDRQSVDEQEHRDLMERINTTRTPNPDVADDDTRLISSCEQPTLLCGDYGGHVPQSPTDFPTQSIVMT